MCCEEIKKAFSTLSPNTSFWVGFIGAILLLCAIGFFILLGLMVNGDLPAFASEAGDKKAAADANKATPPAAENNDLTGPVGAVKAVNGRDHSRGDDNASLTLIEYSDFECPFCKRFHDSMKQLMAAYPGKIKWIYRHFPLGFHANAQKEAEASECAYELGGHEKFWAYTDKIYERTTSNGAGFDLADLPKLAKELGLNQKDFENCLNSGKYKEFINQTVADAQAAGIQGTPGTVVLTAEGEKKLIKGALPLESLKQIIDQAL